MRVLLLDDDKVMRRAIIAMLTHFEPSTDVEEASNGHEALLCYRERGPFDLVLTDYEHPGLDGYSLLDTILKENPRQAIACMTGDRQPGQTLWNVLKVPTLLKPFERYQLEGVVILAKACVALRHTTYPKQEKM